MMLFCATCIQDCIRLLTAGSCADSEQQLTTSQQQQEYAVQQLNAFHAANGEHGHLTQENLAAALQLASDHALGLAAQADGIDGLGQVVGISMHHQMPVTLSNFKQC